MPSLLQHNLERLPPKLRARVEAHIASTQGQRYETVSSENGWPIARIPQENGLYHTNSLLDPWSEASRWADSVHYDHTRVSILYGCSFGYPLLEYIKRKKPYTTALIFEQDLCLFYTMLCELDLAPLLEAPDCRLLVGGVEQLQEQLEDALTGELILHSSRLDCHFTPLAHRNQKEAYLQLHEWWMDILNLAVSSVGNSVHDTLIGLLNTIDNAEAIIRSPRLSAMRGAFRGVPAFIIANGPSLDRNMEQLRGAVGRSLMLTAESALRPCLARGIVPDAICVTERSPDVYHFHFAAEPLPEQVALVGLTLLDPRIPSSMPGPWIPVFRRLETSTHWVQRAIMESGEALKGGSSSAHLAFEFALWAGADPIIFVGQDLAFGPELATHSTQSIYAKAQLAGHVQALRSQQLYEVPGLNGQPVQTTRLWLEFKSWFEQHISLNPDRQYIDATEGGAVIQGTVPMTLQEAVQRYCTNKLDQRLTALALAAAPTEEALWLPQRKKRLLQQCADIQAQLLTAAALAEEDVGNCLIIEQACRLHERYPHALMPSFVEQLIQEQGIAYTRYAAPEISTYMQPLLLAYHTRIDNLGEITSLAQMREMNGIQMEMFQAISEMCRALSDLLGLAGQRLDRN
ncbi:motility associated factor glycosyltransferase family protein [Paenibacillus sp. SYP-B4298]|uniref:motility associated factor glycosyltransferase family protein n=1 Tax=Paenibacillus sp. SYP-B4298 TaxID=2996034 RepID=UPI0022DDA78E|nr:6-hydroxymethylpterin diphosphokinase MptE-like protein [Paenibacillus sp. SYP-B4298]